jgi:hypothetical protein
VGSVTVGEGSATGPVAVAVTDGEGSATVAVADAVAVADGVAAVPVGATPVDVDVGVTVALAGGVPDCGGEVGVTIVGLVVGVAPDSTPPCDTKTVLSFPSTTGDATMGPVRIGKPSRSAPDWPKPRILPPDHGG